LCPSPLEMLIEHKLHSSGCPELDQHLQLERQK
jgi:hypothetical protein